MAGLYELDKPINQKMLDDLRSDPQKPLENLQGDILQGHRRSHSVHIFFSFEQGKRDEVKLWINELADYLTSAERQLAETEQYRKYRIPGGMFMSFFLTEPGYRYLLGRRKDDPLLFEDKAFLSGMKRAKNRLNDPSSERWEVGYAEKIDADIHEEMHAMLMLADDDEHSLLREARDQLSKVEAFVKIRAVEHGRVMRNAQGNSIEHFGYSDSRVQPLFFEEDIDWAKQKRKSIYSGDIGAGPNLVLVRDPYGYDAHDSGSYLVFRKLEQHVRDFKRRVQELADALGLDGEHVNRAGALVIGRFEDGTPVVSQPTAGRPTNDFNYNEDPEGEKCPFQAHIRKVNPRGEDSKSRRIARRGIPYGKRAKEPKDNPSLEELPNEGVGLLFMCYQRSIRDQFEVLQEAYANDPYFPFDKDPGIDPVIGQSGIDPVIEQSDEKTIVQQKWPALWGDPREKHKPFDFQSFVTLKGGGYFFAPSISSLKAGSPLMK